MKVYPVFQKHNQEKIELCLKHSNLRNYVIWIAGTHTGLRVSDILSLKPCHFNGSFLTLTEQKTNKTKEVKISSKLKSVINELITKNNIQQDEYLFQGRKHTGLPITRQHVSRILKEVASKLNVPENISSHSMRKTFAYNLYTLSNNNIALVMQALNHSHERITLKYLCITDNIINDLIEQF